MKVSITNGRKFTKEILNTLIDCIPSHSGLLNNLSQGLIQKRPGSNKCEKAINFTGIEKDQLKYQCINRSSDNGVREPVLFGFVHDKHPGQKR